MVQICLFLEVFQKITFYHCTLCADIFLAIDWFYYSFYGCKTSLLKGKYIYKIFKNFPNEFCRKGKKQASKFYIFKILSVGWISVYNQRLNTRFRCSGVFGWCYVGVSVCSVVLLFSSVLYSGVPGFIVSRPRRKK